MENKLLLFKDASRRRLLPCRMFLNAVNFGLNMICFGIFISKTFLWHHKNDFFEKCAKLNFLISKFRYTKENQFCLLVNNIALFKRKFIVNSTQNSSYAILTVKLPLVSRIPEKHHRNYIEN